MKGKSPLDSFLFSTVILLILLCVVIAIWYYLPGYLASEFTMAEKGLYGDSYGSVNALFTGLAFAGLIFTIFLQQREIKLHRDDFVNQIKEMQLSRNEVSRQANLQEKQIALGIAKLKMKSLEAEIAYIEMESAQWTEGARITRSGPKLQKVKLQMDELIDSIESEP